MKNQDQSNFVYIPPFSIDRVSDVTFGGFEVQRLLCHRPDKLFYFGETLPKAMIIAANMGKGCHLLTSFEWASLAYLWQKAKGLDELIFDLQSYVWQWNMGLFMHPDGHVDILASLDVSYSGSPYGRGTISGSGGAAPTLIVDGAGINWLKAWSVDTFNGMSLYIAEANDGQGEFYSIADTTPTSVVLSKGADPSDGTATFVIIKHISIDVTSGMSSGERITNLHESDSDLKGFAIPATTGHIGKIIYGSDRYWFYKEASIRAALRGGYFNDGADAGVFALDLDAAPSFSVCDGGFRAAKSL